MSVNKRTVKIRMIYCLAAILVLGSWSQADLLQELQLKYNQYQQKYPSVKLSLLFNQPAFSPGDTAFLSAWYLNDELLPIKGEHFVTLDLLSEKGNTVQRIRFKSRNGKGSSQLVFRNDLLPGTYTVVAYTDWMRNFGTSWFYQKRIQVLSKYRVENKNLQVVAFYPEGGTLLAGISNKIAVTGPPGSEVVVKDGQHNDLARVPLDSAGLGSFLMTPQAGQTYDAETSAGGRRWPLPDIKQNGIAVRSEQKELFEIQLQVPPNSAWAGKEVFAFVSANSKIIFKQRVTLSGNEPFRFLVPGHPASRSVHQLFVFSPSGEALAQRVFVPAATGGIEVKVKFPGEVKQRESVAGTLEILDESGNPLDADLRITAIQGRLFKNQPMGSDFYLSDLPDAAAWMERWGKRYGGSLNDFLITQKWKRTDWQAILSGTGPEILYPFQSQLKLMGQVVSRTDGSAPPDSTIIISFLQNNGIGFEASTFKGKFEVPFIFDFWGDDRAFCTLQYLGRNIDDRYSVIVPPDTLTMPATWTSAETKERSEYGEYAFSKQLVAKSYSFFAGSQRGPSLREQSPNLSIEEEFSGVDYDVKLADYVVFPKMEDLLREIIPFVQSRKKGSRESVRMSFRLETSTRTYTDDPLYVIDGFMSRNTTFFMSLKPENVISIKIINNPNKLAQFGRLGENGIIFVETKKREYTSSILSRNTFPVVGLSKATNFNGAGYAKASNSMRTPDLRSTLYWNPSLQTDNAGHAAVNFFSSDDTGPVLILVQGLTRDGRQFSAEKEINVSFNPGPK